MPMDKKNYPADWDAISYRVKVRAGHRCEWVDPHSGQRCGAVSGNAHPQTGSTVVLAAAHLCSCDPKCGDETHLKALCQDHHLTVDRPAHKRGAAQTRRKRQFDAGQTAIEGTWD